MSFKYKFLRMKNSWFKLAKSFRFNVLLQASGVKGIVMAYDGYGHNYLFFITGSVVA